MASPTFNINDLIGQIGRSPASPFQYPSLAQQSVTMRQPAPTTPLIRRPQQQQEAPQAPVSGGSDFRTNPFPYYAG